MAARRSEQPGGLADLFSDQPAHLQPARHLSPKRPSVETAGLADIFPYYAGFSFEWAREELEQAHQDLLRQSSGRRPIVLDPWNGSGTTTLAAQSLGIPVVGVDLNPVANLVAQLRTQARRGAEVSGPPPSVTQANVAEDGLSAWFDRVAVQRIRDWTYMLDSRPRHAAALGYVALFRVIRKLTTRFEGSNPTWVRRASADDELVRINIADLDELLVQDQAYLRSRLETLDHVTSESALVTGSSCRLPLRDGVIDLILTSPPYLTRIDYAVAYARELAICGIDISSDRRLRAELMGTTLIRPPVPATSYGLLANDLLRQISTHESKASSGYYRKQTVQYLNDLTSSLGELDRVSSANAQAIMVVQDSYYKDVHVRLADICEDEMAARGWACKQRRIKVNRILTSINTAARAYVKGDVHETVLTFTKGGDVSDST